MEKDIKKIVLGLLSCYVVPLSPYLHASEGQDAGNLEIPSLRTKDSGGTALEGLGSLIPEGGDAEAANPNPEGSDREDSPPSVGIVEEGLEESEEAAQHVLTAIRSSTRGNRQEARHVTAQYVIDYPGGVNRRYGEDGTTLLYEAALSGDGRLVKFLLQNGANLDARTAAGHSPLWAALHNGCAWIVRYLTRHGGSCVTELLGNPRTAEYILVRTIPQLDLEFVGDFNSDNEDFDEEENGAQDESDDQSYDEEGELRNRSIPMVIHRAISKFPELSNLDEVEDGNLNSGEEES